MTSAPESDVASSLSATPHLTPAFRQCFFLCLCRLCPAITAPERASSSRKPSWTCQKQLTEPRSASAAAMSHTSRLAGARWEETEASAGVATGWGHTRGLTQQVSGRTAAKTPLPQAWALLSCRSALLPAPGDSPAGPSGLRGPLSCPQAAARLGSTLPYAHWEPGSQAPSGPRSPSVVSSAVRMRRGGRQLTPGSSGLKNLGVRP